MEQARSCIGCGCPIPVARLEALPETRTCISCSTEKKKIALTQSTCKSKGYTLEFFDGNDRYALALNKGRQKGRSCSHTCLPSPGREDVCFHPTAIAQATVIKKYPYQRTARFSDTKEKG